MTDNIHQATQKVQGQNNHEITPYQLLVSCNYSVIPSGGGKLGKSPLVEWERYQHEAPTLEDIGKWEQEYHPRLWGIVTGTISGVVVVDLDSPEYKTLFDKAGLPPHVRTPRGGFHFYFKHPGHAVKTAVGILEKVDIRGDGGFINLLGARADGSYTILIPPLLDALYPWDKLPKEIAKVITRPRKRKPPVEGGVIPETKRNDALTRLAGTLRDKGLGQQAIDDALQAINLASCKPPLAPDEVSSIAHSVAQYETTGDLEDVGDMPITNTDTGNAVRLVKLYGDRIRYCYEQKCWYVWTGRVWQHDYGARINQLATKTVKHIYVEASQAEDAQAKELAKHAIQSEANHRIVAMIARAESQPGIPIGVDQIDTDNWLLNCANGTVDLHTGELLPFNKANYLTHMIATKYDPEATCPTFDKFLKRVLNNDADLISYVQKCVGYSLTGDTRTELVFFVYGEGQNGKSTFISTIRGLLGKYAHRVSPDVFMQMKGKGGGGPKESLANLRGKRFVAASEIEEGRRLHMALVKSLTGAETISADRKYEHEIEWQPTHHLWLSGNYRPEIRDDSIAAWRRLKIVPFTVHIPDEEKDETLKFTLLNELEGILAWCVRGCIAYQQEGLAEPAAVTNATNEYRLENDVLANFIDECCVLEDGASITNKGFRIELKNWCISSGLEPLNTHQIKRLFAGRGIEAGTSSDGKHRIWKGLRMRDMGDLIPEDSDKTTTPSDKTDKTTKLTDKSFVKPPKLPLKGGTKEKFTENTETSVKLSNDYGNIKELPDDFPDYPTDAHGDTIPCPTCGSDLYWLDKDGWKCCNCDPRPEGD